MKRLLSYQCLKSARRIVALGTCLAAVLLLGASAPAQELVKNGNFEAPFPGTDATTNWTLVYADGGPSDFSIAGPSTEANINPDTTIKGAFGAHIRPNNWNYAHAYFKQIVNTGITNGGKYLLTIQRMRATVDDHLGTPLDTGKLRVYLTAISGSSITNMYGDISETHYSTIITGSSSRTIELQLHMYKQAMSNESAEDMKHAECSAEFDNISLTWTP